jgi:phosphotransferase system HPr-like phosphotransfer protein
MKSVKIRLSTIADVRDFVNIVSQSDVDVDLASGRYLVDGKSIMGIFSLDLTKPVKLIFHDDNKADELFARLNKYVVEAPEA